MSDRWERLRECADDRSRLDDRELDAITEARTGYDPWDWDHIADALTLPSGEAAQRRYRELSDRKVGLDDGADRA